MTVDKNAKFDAIIKNYLLAGHDPNVLDQFGKPLIHRTVSHGSVEATRLLIHFGADPNAKDTKGRTPLHEAVSREGKVGGCYGDVSMPRRFPLSLLEGKVGGCYGDVSMFQLLLDAGADPNAKEDVDGRTPLHGAAGNATPEICQLLLDRGAASSVNVCCNDEFEWSPLASAVWRGDPSTVQILLNAGADPNITNQFCFPFGETVMHLYVKEGCFEGCFNKEVAKLLHEAGADLNIKRKMDGKTAYDLAAEEILSTPSPSLTNEEIRRNLGLKNERELQLDTILSLFKKIQTIEPPLTDEEILQVKYKVKYIPKKSLELVQFLRNIKPPFTEGKILHIVTNFLERESDSNDFSVSNHFSLYLLDRVLENRHVKNWKRKQTAEVTSLFDQLAQITARPDTPHLPDGHQTGIVVKNGAPEQADGIEAPAGEVIAKLHCYKEGIAPDYTVLFGDLDGVQVERLELIDPHAMSSDDARRALIQIIYRISRFAKIIEKTILVFKSEKKQTNAQRYYSTQRIHRNLHEIRTTLTYMSHEYNFPCPNIEYRELSRTKDRDFHDRFIKIRFKRDGAMFDREYICVRGLDAFVRHEFCARIVVKSDVEVIQNTDS